VKLARITFVLRHAYLLFSQFSEMLRLASWTKFPVKLKTPKNGPQSKLGVAAGLPVWPHRRFGLSTLPSEAGWHGQGSTQNVFEGYPP
jgi:hypothetical protein